MIGFRCFYAHWKRSGSESCSLTNVERLLFNDLYWLNSSFLLNCCYEAILTCLKSVLKGWKVVNAEENYLGFWLQNPRQNLNLVKNLNFVELCQPDLSTFLLKFLLVRVKIYFCRGDNFERLWSLQRQFLIFAGQPWSLMEGNCLNFFGNI